jgi:hypothetical protein
VKKFVPPNRGEGMYARVRLFFHCLLRFHCGLVWTFADGRRVNECYTCLDESYKQALRRVAMRSERGREEPK